MNSDVDNDIRSANPFAALVRSRAGLLAFAVIVAIPALLYFILLAGFTSPQYTSEFRVLVRTPRGGNAMELPQLMGLSLPAQSSENSYAVIQYLQSPQGAEDLQDGINLRQYFSSDTVDFLSRLSPDASNAGFIRYWGRKLDAYFENTTGTVVVRVAAFSPQDAHAIAAATLHLSEKLVNNMSTRSRGDLVSYATADVASAQRAMRDTEARMLALRNQRGLIDPRGTATANLQRQGQLQTAISQTNAALATRVGYLSSSSPIVSVLRRRLAALQTELARVSAESTAQASGAHGTLSTSISAFEQMEADQSFAQKSYQTALAGLQAAKSEQARQQYYLDTIVQPTLPDERASPRLLRDMLVFVAVATALWVLFLLLFLSAREHR